MSLAIFNINDAGLQLSLNGDLIDTSRGYAVLDGDKLMVGEEAAQNTKLLTGWTNNKFWNQLTTTPIKGKKNQIRHHADLAFAHLEDLWEPISDKAQAALFIVPGHYHGENLSLLLGIAKECNIPVRGVVDNSILAASDLPLRRHVIHLDLHLHSITLTCLTANGHSIARSTVDVVVETGLTTLLDRWADIIANQLIQTTRFDPMHDADSEQQLFNLLPSWIRQLGPEQMYSFSMRAVETEHTVAISRENLLRACAPIYPQIVQAIRTKIPSGAKTSLLLSHQFEGFPGLKESLQLISDIEIIHLHASKINDSAYLYRDQILSPSDSAITHVLKLDISSETEQDSSNNADSAPTHILLKDIAYPIGKGRRLPIDDSAHRKDESQTSSVYFRNGELILETSDSQHATVNSTPVESTSKLRTGDIIEYMGQRAAVITVIEDG